MSESGEHPIERAKRMNRKLIDLALQGGGSHGAFTWGVLDRVLEDGRLEIEAISGTSAGAMNAAVVAEGVMKGDYEGARAALARFWRGVAKAAEGSPLKRSPVAMFFGDWSLDNSPLYLWFDIMSRMVSPYDLNPLNVNPLRDLLDELVDFDAVRACDKLKVFIAATNVESGRTRIFKRTELTADHVMASACLPYLFQAVEIDGRPYWDGGYVGNPPLFPFFRQTACSDVLIVQINPVERKGAPKTARDIMERINEITFNSSLLREFRAIEFVSRLIDQGKLSEDSYKKVRVHRIDGGAELARFGASSKLIGEWAFFQKLFELGRASAHTWIDRHYDDIGQRSSLDLPALLNDPEVGI
ncbi:MAG: patatin-like phospholipase family protein [Maricaulaceae bacterium]